MTLWEGRASKRKREAPYGEQTALLRPRCKTQRAGSIPIKMVHLESTIMEPVMKGSLALSEWRLDQHENPKQKNANPHRRSKICELGMSLRACDFAFGGQNLGTCDHARNP